ncbi:dihydroneopterin aldolase [Litoreibacter arenae]|uniref:dihydroneopterin aldolase n=1 Tax=Litoreibacter arenae DSM 19593 TaxID=1123360 RepID=S9QF92_9RHOB|nr:dihydroneopterin aldolase [Litoreibacter arenae]EPX80076.1 Dihydroneopterin aldolase / delta 1-pyrroline-5-carboxylate synthetase [Litoreibacter arenae DSM 19593]
MSSDIRLAFAHPSERAAATSGTELRDRISLRDHIREVEIGAFQQERGSLQRICFNVVVEVKLPELTGAGGVDDDVDKILSYDTITEAIDRELQAERLNLLETLAAKVAEDILADPRAARVFVRIEKLDRGPGALGVEIVRDRDMIARATETGTDVAPLVAYLGNDVIGSDRLPKVLDALQGQGVPVILCVPMGQVAAPRADHPAAQRRIDLLALEQNAWVLAARDRRCVVVSSRTELDWAIKHDQMSVWAPSKLVLDATDGPDADTSDAVVLAQWLGREFDALRVVSVGDMVHGAGDIVAVDELLANGLKLR